MNTPQSLAALLFAMTFAAALALAQGARPTPPTRDPHTPGYVAAKELPDGAVPPADVDGNFIIGPTHNARAGNDRRRTACRRERFTTSR